MRTSSTTVGSSLLFSRQGAQNTKKGRGFFKGDVFHMLPCLVKQNYIKSKVFKGNFTGNFGGMYWKNNKNIPAARKARLHFGQIL